MPIYKVKGGYRYGKHGKVYKRKSDAERQARAIHARKAAEDKKKKNKK